MMLLDQLFSRKLSKPFIKMPPDDALPMLSQTEVVCDTYHAILLLYRKQCSLRNLRNLTLKLSNQVHRSMKKLHQRIDPTNLNL